MRVNMQQLKSGFRQRVYYKFENNESNWTYLQRMVVAHRVRDSQEICAGKIKVSIAKISRQMRKKAVVTVTCILSV
jgi:hypothetical protein